ncbi:uncharacterized protein LOC125853525 [Solanum stenotomum]|uniref:uncharacterized protein LOC125853525 n=1 Tax=Solanum stenotomum TaxID=172797 RepID=UPI0020D11BCC|nr:uncharacterized protein LOC125853525 [Solanum stenotomum]
MALYGRKCKSPIGWFEVGEVELIGPNLVHQAMEKVKIIQETLKTTQSHQKSYTYVRRRDLEFEVDDWISKRVDKVAYEFDLPSELATVHLVFHVSMLKKCLGDPSLIVPTENIGIKDNLSYENVTIQILDRHKLRTKEVVSAKVLWSNQYVEEAT